MKEISQVECPKCRHDHVMVLEFRFNNKVNCRCVRCNYTTNNIKEFLK